MATYRFKCEECGHIESYNWPMSKVVENQKKLGRCGVCGGKLMRIYEFEAVHFAPGQFTRRSTN